MARTDWGIGLVGLGRVAQTHLEGYLKRGLSVVGGADLDADRTDQTRERFDLSFVPTDYRELIDHPEIRIIDVTVPHHRLDLRLPIVEYAAEKGKALYIQKPLMRNLSEATQLVEAAETHRVPLMVNQNSVFAPGSRIAEKLLREGDSIGTPYYCQVQFRQWFEPGTPWEICDERCCVADMAIHHFALLRHWFGEVERVHAVLGPDLARPSIIGDMYGAVSLGFRSGLNALVINNWCYRGDDPREEIVVQGETGELIVRDLNEVVVRGVAGMETRPPVTGTWWPDGFGATMEHFVESLDRDAPFLCEGRDNLKTLAISEAAYISAAEGRVVDPDKLL